MLGMSCVASMPLKANGFTWARRNSHLQSSESSTSFLQFTGTMSQSHSM